MKLFTEAKHYYKLIFLLLTIFLAYFFFSRSQTHFLFNFILSWGYVGTFLLGVFFSYGFTTAPATALLLLITKEQNIFLASFLAGMGALLGNLLAFATVKFTFEDEIKWFSREKEVVKIDKEIFHHISKKYKKYILLTLAGFIIASPLPDEIGISLLAASKEISFKLFPIFSLLLHMLGIFIILFVGKAI